ncbi:MAG TPA: flagellar basal body L-ring protein FlgH [Gammaproteobacteria bacterium]|nr:flagellar basal body L-ring protein FlgH [Gammaproteobacteria bacterium]
MQRHDSRRSRGVRRSHAGLSLLAVLAAAVLAGGCAAAPVVAKGGDARFAATRPLAPVPAERNQGSIYQPASASSLFEDYKAGRVGDVLTVLLTEQTDARKSANASTSRSANAELLDPILAGRPVTHNGVPILNTDVDSKQSFDGAGSAEQSNELKGSIAVTVAEVLPNGNLVVQGEKWMKINQGQEYIRLRGVVRPVDIGANNTVLSTQVADAELAYGGTGTVAQSSKPGWLSRFFASPLWPF